MAKEILKDEILKDEQLEGVAGGTLAQTAADMDRFTRETGMRLHSKEQFRDILFRCGIKIKDHGGAFEDNEYYLLDRQGNRIRALDERTAMNTAIHNYNNGIFIC